ncbi:unnamed protein product [Ranitomeya imitator]|uniref:Reverse transcriptase domain-containing protein n=1 Tax=Ranitomeya imitator TaxID=111125 RepID=A0ABN9MUJ8_9NEOB|nr:unnamed protein product [Ranitomeya imitator]
MDRGKFHFHTNLSYQERIALEHLSSDKSLIFKPADKGGATVVMDRADYLEEVFRQLGDTTVYRIIPHNPLNQIVKKIAPIVEFHFQAGTIDSKMRDFLIHRDPITPIFYILPKIHKRLVKPPGRPIVSLTDSVLSPLSMVLEKILTPLVKTTRSFLLDTSNFIQIIKSLGPLAPSSLLVTWDVNSLYTSIVHEKGLLATDRLLSENRVDIKIRHLCADLLGIVLKENYFMFQDTFYAQQQGTAMGANVAPPYAIAYMAAFESDFVYNHPLFMAHCRVWRRYIDDIFCVWDGPIESLLPFDQHINSIWPELKFTLQHDTHKISFLDTLVYKEREVRLGIDLFTKPTDQPLVTSCAPSTGPTPYGTPTRSCVFYDATGQVIARRRALKPGSAAALHQPWESRSLHSTVPASSGVTALLLLRLVRLPQRSPSIPSDRRPPSPRTALMLAPYGPYQIVHIIQRRSSLHAAVVCTHQRLTMTSDAGDVRAAADVSCQPPIGWRLLTIDMRSLDSAKEMPSGFPYTSANAAKNSSTGCKDGELVSKEYHYTKRRCSDIDNEPIAVASLFRSLGDVKHGNTRTMQERSSDVLIVLASC